MSGNVCGVACEWLNCHALVEMLFLGDMSSFGWPSDRLCDFGWHQWTRGVMTNLSVHFKGKFDALVSMKIQIKGHSNLNVYFTFFCIQQNKNQVDRPARRRLTGQPEQHWQNKSKKTFTHMHVHTQVFVRSCAVTPNRFQKIDWTAYHAVSLRVSIGTRCLLKHCVHVRSFWCVLCHTHGCSLSVTEPVWLLLCVLCHSIVIRRDMLW